MTTEVLIECIERCITITKKASDDCDNSRCSMPYALGVYESCMESIEHYVNTYKEEEHEQFGNV